MYKHFDLGPKKGWIVIKNLGFNFKPLNYREM